MNQGQISLTHHWPFLRQGKRKSLTRPKSSPVTMTLFSKAASVALTSLVSVYFSQMPFTSGPRTPVKLYQWMLWISSVLVTCLPTANNKQWLELTSSRKMVSTPWRVDRLLPVCSLPTTNNRVDQQQENGQHPPQKGTDSSPVCPLITLTKEH